MVLCTLRPVDAFAEMLATASPQSLSYSLHVECSGLLAALKPPSFCECMQTLQQTYDRPATSR